MIDIKKLESARATLVGGYQANGANYKSVTLLVKKMPSAVRRMGLVRAIEWMQTGKQHSQVGQALFAAMAPLMLLPHRVSKAVEILETCDRTELFGYHRRAIELFDTLSLLHRAQESR